MVFCVLKRIVFTKFMSQRQFSYFLTNHRELRGGIFYGAESKFFFLSLNFIFDSNCFRLDGVGGRRPHIEGGGRMYCSVAWGGCFKKLIFDSNNF